MKFQDREDAGRRLAEKIATENIADPVVICLPRGGVPIGFEIAEKLDCKCDILVVRKLGAPQNEEFGVGAITEQGFTFIQDEWVDRLHLSQKVLDGIIAKERIELRRRVEKYRGSRPMLDVRGKNVLLVDDGLATGVTAVAASLYLSSKHAHQIFLCVPVCSREGREQLEKYTQKIICLFEPPIFRAVGDWYQSFPQLRDGDVTQHSREI